jgi:hypothetical protein
MSSAKGGTSANDTVHTLHIKHIDPGPTTIYVRGFVPPPKAGKAAEAPKGSNGKRGNLSKWTLVFDTETAIDAGQHLRFGVYQLRNSGELIECGIFYDGESLNPGEQSLLECYAHKNGMKFLTKDEFVEGVFFSIGYEWRASIIGFNLPFDLSRLAIGYGSARGKTMKGGFTFKLSPRRWWPNIQVKHLSNRSALIQFTTPPRRRDTKSERRKKFVRRARRGSFIDVKTIAAALLSRSFSLASLSEFLNVEHKKQATDEHGGLLTEKYIAYCVNDVQATWECFQVLQRKFTDHRLGQTGAGQILSEATLGKAYLKEMGVRPFREVQPDFPDHLVGIVMSAYFGGRSEVRLRRVRTQVLYCDFLSMYPTVCTLMGLWRFVIADGLTWKDATAETQKFVETVSLTDLQRPDFWQSLTTLVRIRPDRDILPIRAKYSGDSQTIGLNFLSGETPLWYTLADVIASRLLTGKTPTILEAITFKPGEPQAGLRPLAIAGKTEYRVDPVTDDFFKRLIDLRATVKSKMKGDGPVRDTLDAEQLALKILANATSYGIFVEVNVNNLEKRETRNCFGTRGIGFPIETDKSEEPGKYFHPLLATLITGAARLMLAISETLTLNSGLDWAFCDTDSMAIAKPADMDDAIFFAKALSVCNWFEPLNPYEQKGSLFKTEDANYRAAASNEKKQLEPLYCLCISSKRYVLFNMGSDGKPITRKASAHGLGHLLSPYTEVGASASIPAPTVPLPEIGVERWQYDLWYQIIVADLEGHPEQVDLGYHSSLEEPAASRYGATTPDLLRWFNLYNQNRSFRDQMKPFNFLTSFQSGSRFAFTKAEVSNLPKRGRRPKSRQAKPVAPFSKDIRAASREAFDRETGEAVSSETLRTYRQALAQYHVSPESKFQNGDFLDSGRTERRHILVTGISHIGKEANRWEEQFFTGVDEEAQIEYGADASDGSLDRRLRKMCRELGQRETARELRISRMTLRKAVEKGCASLSPALRNRLILNREA